MGIQSLAYALQGTMVNGIAIVLGGVVGFFLGKRLPEEVKNVVMQAIGLSVILIGLKMALGTQNAIVVIFSLILGGIIGEVLAIDHKLHKGAAWLESRVSSKGSDLSKAMVFTTLIYVVGAMSITGALESGLLGTHEILYVKSILDGTTAIAFAATMGMGVVLSAIPVFLYQGAIAVAAGSMQKFIGPNVISELEGVGGLLILAIGLNLLELKNIKVANFLPSFVVVIIWMAIVAAL